MRRCLGCFELIDDTLGTCPVCGYIEKSSSGDELYLVPGTELSDRYTIGKVIESDKTSVSYIAWDNTSGIKVKIKEFLPGEYISRTQESTTVELKTDCEESFNEGYQAFINEARRIYSEGGDIKLYDCIAENNTAYMILEWIEKSSYGSYLKPVKQQETTFANTQNTVDKSVQEDKKQEVPISDSQQNKNDNGFLQKLSVVPLWLKILVPAAILIIVAGVILVAGGVLKNKDTNKNVSNTEENTEALEITTTEAISTSETSNETPPPENGWYQNGNDYYFYQDGKKVNGWLRGTECWYYFDPDTGLMTTGWRYIDGKRYRFTSQGEMLKGWQCIDGLWYFFDEKTGVMQTGWVEHHVGEQTDMYYMNLGTGARERGWLEVNGSKYYLNPEDCKMVKGWKQIDGSWYYFDDNGVMQKGWLELEDTWYYLDDSGKMVTDKAKIDGVEYRFESDGTLCELSTEQAQLAFQYYMADSDKTYFLGYKKGYSWDYVRKDEDAYVFGSGYATRSFSTYYMNQYTGITSSSSYTYPDVDDVQIVDEVFNAWDYLKNPPTFSDNGTTNLQSLMDTNFSAAVDEIGNLKNSGATDGIEYRNDEIIIGGNFGKSSDRSDITVSFISIKQPGSYSIYGVSPGMNEGEAINRLIIEGAHEFFRENERFIKIYMDGKKVINLYSDNNAVVTSISISEY